MIHAAGRDVAWCHGVHAHAAVCPFHGGRLRETHHTGPRGPTVSHARHGAPHVGHDVDDAAPALLHGLQVTLAGHQETTGQIGINDRLPAFGADGFQRRDVLAARVVHQPVHTTLRGHDGSHCLFHNVFLPYVTHLKTGCATVLRDLFLNGFQLLNIAPHQHHLSTQCAQFVRHAAANARAATGNHHHLASHQPWRKNRTIRRHPASGKNKTMAASVRSSSDAAFFLSNHCTDQLRAPRINSRASPTGALSRLLTCSSSRTGIQADS